MHDYLKGMIGGFLVGAVVNTVLEQFNLLANPLATENLAIHTLTVFAELPRAYIQGIHPHFWYLVQWPVLGVAFVALNKLVEKVLKR